jgi:homospermidine synthase
VNFLLSMILARVLEPSTWAGVSMLLQSAAHLTPGTAGAVANVGSAVAAGLAVVLKEKGIA